MNMSRLIKRNLINNDGFATHNLYPACPASPVGPADRTGVEYFGNSSGVKFFAEKELAKLNFYPVKPLCFFV